MTKRDQQAAEYAAEQQGQKGVPKRDAAPWFTDNMKATGMGIVHGLMEDGRVAEAAFMRDLMRHLKAAERTPLPDHCDLPAAVADLRERVAALEDHFVDASKMVAPPQPAPVTPAGRLRTERVTLEVTHACHYPLSEWILEPVWEVCDEDESVRVVEESVEVAYGQASIDRLTAERNAAKEEAERLRHLLKTKESECETHHPWVHPSFAPAANAGVEQPQPPRGWLTEGERRLIERLKESSEAFPPSMKYIDDVTVRDALAMYDALLARETPPRVKLPRYLHAHPHYGQVLRDVSAAIREAGGEVE